MDEVVVASKAPKAPQLNKLHPHYKATKKQFTTQKQSKSKNNPQSSKTEQEEWVEIVRAYLPNPRYEHVEFLLIFLSTTLNSLSHCLSAPLW